MTSFIENATLIKAFNYRFATKKFDPQKSISSADFDTILQAGRLSPSSFGLEPWKFVVITNKSLKEKLAKLASGMGNKAIDCSHVVIYLSATEDTIEGNDGLFYKKMLERFGNNKEMIESYIGLRKVWQANFNKILTEQWASKQTYIALGNMLTAAALLGIDSCPVEGFVKEEIDLFLKNDLQIDITKYHTSVLAAFGYRNMEQPQKTRKHINDVVEWFN